MQNWIIVKLFLRAVQIGSLDAGKYSAAFFVFGTFAPLNFGNSVGTHPAQFLSDEICAGKITMV